MHRVEGAAVLAVCCHLVVAPAETVRGAGKYNFKEKDAMNSLRLLTTAITLSCAADMAHAALYYRGNGMVYDSSQNITWMQDANYAHTAGFVNTYDGLTDGRMRRWQAEGFVANLNFGGYDDWRLPKEPAFPESELLSLYRQLGNTSVYDTPRGGSGWVNTSFVDGATGITYSFLNVQKQVWVPDLEIWASAYYVLDGAPYPGCSGCGWWRDVFVSENGGLASDGGVGPTFLWAVRDGDVAQVPVPAAAWLFGSGLAGLVVACRSRKQ